MKYKTYTAWTQDSLEIDDYVATPGFIGKIIGLKQKTVVTAAGELAYSMNRIVRLFDKNTKTFKEWTVSGLNYEPASPDQIQLYDAALIDYLQQKQEESPEWSQST